MCRSAIVCYHLNALAGSSGHGSKSGRFNRLKVARIVVDMNYSFGSNRNLERMKQDALVNQRLTVRWLY